MRLCCEESRGPFFFYSLATLTKSSSYIRGYLQRHSKAESKQAEVMGWLQKPITGRIQPQLRCSKRLSMVW